MLLIGQNITFLLLLSAVLAFPTTRWASSPFTVSPLTESLLRTSAETEGSDLIMYTPSLNTLGLTYKIRRWNATATPPVLLSSGVYTFASLITNTVLTVLDTMLLVSYEVPLLSLSFNLWIHKGNMSTYQTLGGNAQRSGKYLSAYDIFFYHELLEYALYQPTLPGATQLAMYNNPTAFPKQIQYFYPADQSKIFTFYTDRNYFLVRNLTANLAQLTADYLNPQQVALPGSGFQAACFSPDYALLYVLDGSGNVLFYNVLFDMLTTLSASAYSGVNNCYYDKLNHGIVFTKDTTGTSFYFYDLTTLSQTSSTTSTDKLLTIDQKSNYIVMATTTDVGLYAEAPSACLSSEYHDSLTLLCQACPTECLSCLNSLICTNCQIGYTLDPSNQCLLTPQNVTQNATQNISQGAVRVGVVMGDLVENIVLETLSRIPGGRKWIPFLCFLFNIDELWLYQYHERDYGETMNSFFQKMQMLENEKWRVLEEETVNNIYAEAGTSKKAIFSLIDTKFNYSHTTFRNLEDRG
jgi:hypothetical protein